MGFAPNKTQIDAYARSNGFPNSDFPYYEMANECGSGKWCKVVPNGWYPVPFSGICNKHDRCYLTYGTKQSVCDSQFLEDLQAAMRRGLTQKTKDIPNFPGINPIFPAKAKVVTGSWQGSFRPSATDLAIYQLSGILPPTPLPIGFILPRKADAIEPSSLARGMAIARIYYAAVCAAGGSYHGASQIQAKKYKDLVEAYIAQCQRSLVSAAV